VLVFYLIPNYVAVGASIALICGVYVLFLNNCYFVYKSFGTMRLFSGAFKPVICSIIMWTFMNMLVEKMYSGLLIFLALVVYIVTLFFLKTFTTQETESIKNFLVKLGYRFAVFPRESG